MFIKKIDIKNKCNSYDKLNQKIMKIPVVYIGQCHDFKVYLELIFKITHRGFEKRIFDRQNLSQPNSKKAIAEKWSRLYIFVGVIKVFDMFLERIWTFEVDLSLSEILRDQ